MMNWKVIKYIFKCLCLIATCVFVGMWFQRYLLDEDMSLIDNNSYYENEDDLFPMMSLCFKQSFDDKLFKPFGQNISGSNYRKYLLGGYFDHDMAKVNYDSVTTNISEYVITYDVSWRNGSNNWDTPHLSTSWKHPYHTYSWDSWGRF